MSAAFDTLKFVRRLRESGFSESQAEAIAEAFQDASTEALATKHDIELLRHDLKETELRLTGDLTLVKWMLGLIVVAEVAPWLVKFFSGA
jgi:hypothetical protein